MYLWYPETSDELLFIEHSFPEIPTAQVGIRHVSRSHGFLYSDNSYGIGVIGHTTTMDGATHILDFDDYDLMQNGKCITYNFATKNLTRQTPCPEVIGLCKSKLGIV